MRTPKSHQTEVEDFKHCPIPPLGEKVWEVPAASLLEYLETPRDISDIMAWGSADERSYNKVFTKNLIAYLSCNGKIDFDPVSGVWRRI
jgi:hypothetical protein